jgi:hypothetical protein
MLLPGSGTVSNSQCTITAGGSLVGWVDKTLILTLPITFSPSFAGNKVVFLAAQDKASSPTGWQPLGTWGVPGTAMDGPSVGGVTPARSNSRSQNYSFAFTDTNGWRDIAVASVLINASLDGRHACYAAFVPSGLAASEIFLVSDAADSYQPSAIPGSGIIANGQCSINAGASSVVASGNTLTVNLALTFAPGFAGNRILFLEARSKSLSSGWQAVGTVSVPQ